VDLTSYKEEIFSNDGGETLAQVAQRGGRCSIPGNLEGLGKLFLLNVSLVIARRLD